MSQDIGRLRSSPLVAVALIICAGHVALALLLGRDHGGSLASNAVQCAAALTAMLLCFEASRRATGFSRRMWTLVATAFGIWSVTQAIYTYHQGWLGTDAPQSSWTQFLFRLYRAPWLMALLITPDEEEEPSPDWQQRLDFAQVGILFLFFYFALYFVPGFERWLSPLTLGGFLELSDLENWLLLAAFMARARLSRRPREGALYQRLVPYLLLYAAASSFANYADAFWRDAAGTWPDVPFTLSLAAGGLLAASWRAESGDAERETRPLPAVYWTPAILPLLNLALAFSVARHAPGVAFVAAFLSVACFGARLIIALYRQRRLLEALRSSEMQYALLVRMAPDAIFVHVAGRVTFANPAAAQILGVPDPQDLVGRHIVEFGPPEQRNQMAGDLAGLGAAPSLRRWTAMRPDGVRVSLEAVGMSLPPAGPGTGPPSRLVIARDVTQTVRVEAEREALIRNLEAKNAELERFTYTASHDLRSPLITVNGFLSHIEDAAKRGDVTALQADIERVRRATKKMDNLLRDLLDLSRVGHVTAPAEPVSFEALCREALEAVRGRLHNSGVTVDIEPNLPVVQVDRVRLVEALQNLLDNAAKFMGPQPAPRISVGVLDLQGEPTFYVKDNGIGIEPRHHQTIFGLFDKLDPGAEGTGIGLALAKRIIELQGGRIWVESKGQGTGATFYFTLPLSPVPAE